MSWYIHIKRTENKQTMNTNNQHETFNHPQYDEDCSHETETPNSEFYDDCMVHVIRNGWDYVFYTGTNMGGTRVQELTENDVPRLTRVVDTFLGGQ